MELHRNKAYYYTSSLGGEYSHWTDEGKEALLEFMKKMTPLMQQAEEMSLDKRAKDMVINELKGVK